MTVNLSALAGAGQQFFDNNGVILSGGKLYSYAAGTTTPQATYTSVSGATAHTNPIILNSAGRVATGEIWLTDGVNYKFALYTSTDVLIATWDNISGINSIPYATNVVFTGFKGQIGFVSDLANDDGSDWIGFTPAGSNAVSRSAQDKLREVVSVKDFGAVGDGVVDDTASIAAAHATGQPIYYPSGTYLVTAQSTLSNVNFIMYGESATLLCGTDSLARMFQVTDAARVLIEGMRFDANNLGKGFLNLIGCPDAQIRGCKFEKFKNDPTTAGNFSAVQIAHCPNARIVENYFENIGEQFGGSGIQPAQYRAVTANTGCDKVIVSDNVFQSVFGGFFIAEFPQWVSGTAYVVNNQVNFFNGTNFDLYRCSTNNTASGANQPPNASFWTLERSNVRPIEAATFCGNVCRNIRDNAIYHIEYVKSITVTGNSFVSSNDEPIVVVGDNITITGNTFLNTGNKAISLELGVRDITAVTISGNTFLNDNASFQGDFIDYRNNSAAFTVKALTITGNTFKSDFSIAPASYIKLRKCENLTITGNVFDVAAVADEVVVRSFERVGRGVISNNVFLTASTTAQPFRNDDATSKVLFVNNLMNGRILANETSELVQLGYIQDTGSNIYIREPISRLLWGNAAPTAGNWTRGDIVFNQFPASGGFIGWVYTNAGWKTFGLIS